MPGKKKGGLGRGLDALISSSRPHEETSSQESSSTLENAPVTSSKTAEKKAKIGKAPVSGSEIMVKIDEIEPNVNQPRKDFNEDSLQELAESIRMHGIIQPLIVTKEENYYRIIAGERRWRAARIAGLTEVPVIVQNYSPQEAVEVALIENIQRQDLNAIEEAKAYQSLIDQYGLTQEETADKVAKSRAAVANSLRLLHLDDRVQQMLAEGMISGGHGKALLAIEDPDTQYKIAMQIFDNKLSVRETERIIRNLQKPAAPARNKLDPEILSALHEMEERMTSVIGSKVSITPRNKKRGKIEIEYYSDSDLDRIINLLSSVK